MPDLQTASIYAQQYVLSTYPCLNAWMDFMKKVFPGMLNYSPTSCAQISSISQATMKTIDYIQQTEPNASVIRVMQLLNNLYDSTWKGWVSFNAASQMSAGIKVLGVQSVVLQGIATFQSWDNALNPSPSFNPPTLLNDMLGGVTP